MIDFDHKIQLAAIERQDLNQMRMWRNNPEIWRWCRQHDLITEADHLRWYEWQAEDPKTKMYKVESYGEMVGICGLTSIDMVNRHAEFSLYIAPVKQGKGLGKAALKTLLSHGFKNLNLHLIWGESFKGNPATSMFTSLGFRYEGDRRDHYFRDGKYINAELYSILETEWNSQLSSCAG